MPSASQRGIQRENDVKGLLESHGYVVGRCAGSLGEFDLIAAGTGFLWHPDNALDMPLRHFERLIMLIEVKSTKAGPYAGFGPADRAALCATALRCGAQAWLVWWPPAQGRKTQPQWVPGNRWPSPNMTDATIEAVRTTT